MSDLQARRDDYQLIGSVVGALTLPALFRMCRVLTTVRRVGLITGMLGGAGLGSAVGVLTFYGKGYLHDNEPVLPVSGEKPIPEQDIPK